MPEPTASQEENKESPQETEKAADGGGSKGTPEGMVPLFFSGKSQEIFECVADTDLTPDNPHKLIMKEKIVEDFKNRAAVSDFFPVKQKVLVRMKSAHILNKAHVLKHPRILNNIIHVQNYPGDELLLVYDYDFKFGENFYICLTEEAKDWVLNVSILFLWVNLQLPNPLACKLSLTLGACVRVTIVVMCRLPS